MASQDAPQWTCRGCRDGLTAPSSHNHRRGSCQFYFDPNQAATNVNPHSKPMSSVDTPVDSGGTRGYAGRGRRRGGRGTTS